MKCKQKSYEDKIDEQMAKMGAQMALLRAVEAGLILVESDIAYYQTIEKYLVDEERWAQW